VREVEEALDFIVNLLSLAGKKVMITIGLHTR
jgi:hypothetical protein